MKVWMFYLNEKSLYEKYKNMSLISEDYDNTGKKPLYAYTDDKTLAKWFKYTRNMDKFKEKIVSLDKDEVKALDDQFYYTSKLTVGEVKYAEDKIVQLALTTAEHWVVVENPKETVTELLAGLDPPSEFLFTPKVRGLLRATKYDTWHKLHVKDPYEEFREVIQAFDKRYQRFAKIISRGYGENQLGLLLYICRDIFDKENLCEVIKHEG